MRYVGVLLTICIVFGCVAPAAAGPALDSVKGDVETILKILKNPAYHGEVSKKTKQDHIRKVAEKMFDYVELSKRTLGFNWNKFSMVQRQEFVDLYRGLLEDAYIDKITSYTDEKITYAKEVQLSKDMVEVQSIIATRSAEIPVNYRMHSKGGQWKVYDVVIEGVSLVNNYRTQFREILANNPPEHLLETLRQKKLQKK